MSSTIYIVSILLVGLSRYSSSRHLLSGVQGRNMPWSFMNSSRPTETNTNNSLRFRGRHLLDQETITCLLVLLFVDEPKLNTSRLHRIFRNLCYHNTTRAWIIKSLLSILHKTDNVLDNDTKCVVTSAEETPNRPRAWSAGASTSDDTNTHQRADSRAVIECNSNKNTNFNTPTWLAMSMDAALGCRTHVFQIQRHSGRKYSSSSGSNLSIHPQASPIICRHVLDTLIILAKQFPAQFLPDKSPDPSQKPHATSAATPLKSDGTTPATPNTVSDTKSNNKGGIDFWETLVRLDSFIGSKKMKNLHRHHTNSTFQEGECDMWWMFCL